MFILGLAKQLLLINPSLIQLMLYKMVKFVHQTPLVFQSSLFFLNTRAAFNFMVKAYA